MGRIITKEAEAATGDIMRLFERYGNECVAGLPLTQTEHSIQAAMLAMEQGGDAELILGAFLHDIGHLLRREPYKSGEAPPELVGAAYLRGKGLSERVCAMVEGRARAFRYLARFQPESFTGSALSAAGMLQGPEEEDGETACLRAHRFFRDMIRLALWDKAASGKEACLLPLGHFRTLLLDYLSNQKETEWKIPTT